MIRLRRVQAQARLDPASLNVLPGLVGVPLARPSRRAAAMLLDLLVLALMSWLSGFGLAADTDTDPGPAASEWSATAPGASRAAAHGAATGAGPGAGPGAAPSARPAADPAARLAALEAELAQLRKPRPWRWREQFDQLLDAVGLGLGWGIVYFSLLPVWWDGQTIGKRVFKLRTLELTGQRLTVMRCLRRYGGYAAGMATGGLGFLAMWWDPNRQGIQDRVAHTVVIDLRLPQPVGLPLSPASRG